VLQPDTNSISSMHETRFFNDKEKSDMYALYKTLMKHHKSIAFLILQGNEKEIASFLKSFFNQWPELKIKILKNLGQMRDSWDKETKIDQDLAYLG